MFNYRSKEIPVWKKILIIIITIAVFAYGTYGLIVDDIFIPARRSAGLHFHGISAIIMYMAIVCGAINALLLVVYHYNTSNNKTHYKVFSKITEASGLALFLFALIVNLFTEVL